MKIYKYDNYQAYVEAQTEANVRKLDWIWVEESTISNIKKLQPIANKILCHGTRNAAEQKFFKKYYPDADILGTEISHTAENFPMTVQHDFHDIREEWINKFDIIYSNSFDHSYDPERSLRTWKDQLSTNGNLYIEHGFRPQENVSKKSDPLQIFPEELVQLFSALGLVYKTDWVNDKGHGRIYQLGK